MSHPAGKDRQGTLGAAHTFFTIHLKVEVCIEFLSEQHHFFNVFSNTSAGLVLKGTR